MTFPKILYTLALSIGLTTLGLAETITLQIPVEADTYLLHGHGINNGYPTSHVSRATSWVAAESLFRFDLFEFDDVGADQIVSATFMVFTGEGTGSMATPVAPAGTSQYAQVTALRTWDSQSHPYGLEYWTEAELGNYAGGYIDGDPIGDNLYDPGDVGGIDPHAYPGEGAAEIEGDLDVILTHDTGPNTWASVDLTDFVKAWLPGGEIDIPNNGIRIHDLGGSGWDEWGWYFFTKDVDGTGTFGLPEHPGKSYVPYLEITYTPTTRIPGDANRDGRVDGSDVTILANNWQRGVGMENPDAEWEMGDFNADGRVDGSDVTILANYWQHGVETSAASVPEPSTLTLLFFLIATPLLRHLKT